MDVSCSRGTNSSASHYTEIFLLAYFSLFQPPKRRIPKHNAPPIEITKPRQFNNGNIEITHFELNRPLEDADKIAVDEVLINGRRYRVPERVVILDFWNKLNGVYLQPDKYGYLLSITDTDSLL